ncbi:hypothetical protein PQX77_005333 [Marasmius sp. AFHP31]|nr:hypothetical protein PQX77_005333 [Marasmius sp. AFHP31]
MTQDSGKRNGNKSIRLIPLKTSNAKYQELRALFLHGWKHPHKNRPAIRGIYLIVYPSEKLEPYRKYRSRIQQCTLRSGFDKGSNEQLLFHGTTRLCALGDSCTISGNAGRSTNSAGDFAWSFISLPRPETQFCRFGTGIYTTSCSSKADDYFDAGGKDSQCRVALVNRVVVGKPYIRHYNATDLVKPPPDHNSVVGVPGAHLNYEETVVYDSNALHPAFLIAYSDSNEAHRQSKAAALLSTLFKTPVAS